MQNKLNTKQIITMVSLAVLLIIAIVVSIAVSKKDDVPAISDETDTGTLSTTQPVEQTTTQEQTTQEEIKVPQTPKYINSLTGFECSEELSKQRPVAMMINNLSKACPQEGISNADIIYECLAEGGITRLMMVVTDYASLGQTGSVRSARDYFLDLVQNHDALYFHAGHSIKADTEIQERKIDNFDGVKMYLPNAFYRDEWRLNNMGMEHSLMIKGEGIVSAIKFKGKRTELKADFKSPFNFPENDNKVELNGDDAACVYLPFSYYQSPWLKYDSTTNTYKRWQYNNPHIDKTNGEQLSFTNILIIGCEHTGPLDSYGRIDIITHGSGTGYYITGGKYVEIKWEKQTVDSELELYNKDGSPLVINKGKSYIAMFDKKNMSNINMNYNA